MVYTCADTEDALVNTLKSSVPTIEMWGPEMFLLTHLPLPIQQVTPAPARGFRRAAVPGITLASAASRHAYASGQIQPVTAAGRTLAPSGALQKKISDSFNDPFWRMAGLFVALLWRSAWSCS
ncbi:hypothetical protein ABZ746_35085 [Streptomyces sp. NPDC020096]